MSNLWKAYKHCIEMAKYWSTPSYLQGETTPVTQQIVDPQIYGNNVMQFEPHYHFGSHHSGGHANGQKNAPF